MRPEPSSQPVRPCLGHAVGSYHVVQPDRDLARPAPCAACGQRRVRQGGRADHDPGHAEVEDGRHVVFAADAPARLHPHARAAAARSTMRASSRPLVRHAGTGRIEVDHVDPFGPALDVGGGQCQRIPVALLPVEVALGQPYGSPVAQIDGWIQESRPHAASATKFASRASPVRPDFSGWNWAPHRFRRATSAATGPP